jgi:hypothetical protein
LQGAVDSQIHHHIFLFHVDSLIKPSSDEEGQVNAVKEGTPASLLAIRTLQRLPERFFWAGLSLAPYMNTQQGFLGASSA